MYLRENLRIGDIFKDEYDRINIVIEERGCKAYKYMLVSKSGDFKGTEKNFTDNETKYKCVNGSFNVDIARNKIIKNLINEKEDLEKNTEKMQDTLLYFNSFVSYKKYESDCIVYYKDGWHYTLLERKDRKSMKYVKFNCDTYFTEITATEYDSIKNDNNAIFEECNIYNYVKMIKTRIANEIETNKKHIDILNSQINYLQSLK